MGKGGGGFGEGGEKELENEADLEGVLLHIGVLEVGDNGGDELLVRVVEVRETRVKAVLGSPPNL
jgi:hypothetical protein